MTTRPVDTHSFALQRVFAGTRPRVWQKYGPAWTGWSQLTRCTLAGSMMALLLLLLTACGPGTGGTGTGTGPISANVFTPLSFSSPAVTRTPPTLSTAGASVIVAPSAPAGIAFDAAPAVPDPCLVNCTDASGTLLIEAQQVQLQTLCAKFVSLSPFVVALTGETVLTGTFETQKISNGAIQSSSLPALLIVEFSSGKLDSDRVNLRVVNTTGALLVGPLALLRDTVVPDPSSKAVTAACPSRGDFLSYLSLPSRIFANPIERAFLCRRTLDQHRLQCQAYCCSRLHCRALVG